MADYFIDSSVVDSGTNDGLTAGAPFNGFVPFAGTPATITFWVRRTAFAAVENVVFAYGENTRYIGWPKEGDDFYDERPFSGIENGWDDDEMDKSEITLSVAGISIIPSVTKVKLYNFKIEDTILDDYPEYDSQGMFSYTESAKIELYNSTLIGERMYYYRSASASYYFSGYTFTRCEIRFTKQLIYLIRDGSYGAGHFYTPKFIECDIHTGEQLFFHEYYHEHYSSSIHIEDCRIFITGNISNLVYLYYYNSNTSRSGGLYGMLTGEIIGGSSTILLQVTKMRDIEIDLKFTDHWTTALLHTWGGATAERFKNLHITLDGYNGDRIFHDTAQVPYSCYFKVRNSTFADTLSFWTTSANNNYFDIKDSSFKHTIIADQTVLDNCRHIGESPYFIYTVRRDVVMTNCNMTKDFCSSGYLQASNTGSLSAYNCSFGKSAKVAQASEGRVNIISTVPAIWEQYDGAIQVEASKTIREGTIAKNSLKFSRFRPGINSWFSYGGAVNPGIQIEVNTHTTHAVLYGLVGGLEMPTNEFFKVIAVSEIPIIEDLEPETDDSIWITKDEDIMTPFKVVIPVSVSFPRKLNVSLVIKDTVLVDSVYFDPKVVMVEA